jgi:hypothetical protein
MSTDRPATRAVDHPLVTTEPKTRKRPLRTYSRRSAGTRPEEQAVPQSGGARKATTPEFQHTTRDQGRAEASPQLPVLPEQNQPERPNRGSILAYFKPFPASSHQPSSDAASSEPTESPSTPSTSPTPPSRSRKRRRLTTRPQFGGLDEHSEDQSEDSPQVQQASPLGTETRPRLSASTDEAATVVRGEALDALRPALTEVAANTVDHPDGSASTVRRMRSKRSTEKRPTRDMTQTTLSLSVQKEPGFTVCGVCDLLYNPFNEKDRREHNRRHAAYSRNKKRAAA